MQKEIFKDATQVPKDIATQQDNKDNQSDKLNELLHLLEQEKMLFIDLSTY
jgi:hypothetical protein